MSVVIEYTDEQLRKLQLNELDLLIEFDRICRKHGINYSLDGGTLLGAIRHKGFVPWDDDIDVMMLRKDYERFLKVSTKELECDYFLQDYRTDEGYRWGYGKLRNLKTEYVKAGHEQAKYTTGVCIDIFALENIPNGHFGRQLFLFSMMCIRKMLYSDIGRFQAHSAFLRGWYRMLYNIPKNTVFRWKESITGRLEKTATRNVINATLPFPKKECKYGYPADFFNEYIELNFEGMSFMAIMKYDLFLKMKYGDYMKLSPAGSRVGVMNASKLELVDITLEELKYKYHKGVTSF